MQCQDLGHEWRGIGLRDDGTLAIQVLEQCERCRAYRMNRSPELIDDRGGDA
jgi:hypothetical protein